MVKRLFPGTFSVPIARGPLLGTAFGFASFALSFAQLRPNRIASGVGLHAWQVLGVFELVLLCAPLLVCTLFVIFSTDSIRTLPLVCGASGNLLICLVFALSGKVARTAAPSGSPFARISMGFGAWLAVLAGYILILYALHDGSLKRGEKLIVALGGIAVLVVLALSGVFRELSVFKEYAARRSRFVSELLTHLLISGTAVGAAIVIGVPLGILAFRNRVAERPVFFLVNAVQTIPSLALFGILIAPLAYISQKYPFLRELGIKGVGAAPALVALTLYALLPIVRNTYTSLKVIDPAVPEAAKGMGMGKLQLLFIVEIPLALPIILSGMRISLVQAVGNTAVAALIGAGGFGAFVFQGLGQAVPDLILLGALPVIILAIVADRAMQVLVRLITPMGMRRTREV